MWHTMENRKRIYLILMYGAFTFKCCTFSVTELNFLPMVQKQLSSTVNVYIIAILQRIFISV